MIYCFIFFVANPGCQLQLPTRVNWKTHGKGMMSSNTRKGDDEFEVAVRGPSRSSFSLFRVCILTFWCGQRFTAQPRVRRTSQNIPKKKKRNFEIVRRGRMVVLYPYLCLCRIPNSCHSTLYTVMFVVLHRKSICRLGSTEFQLKILSILMRFLRFEMIDIVAVTPLVTPL